MCLEGIHIQVGGIVTSLVIALIECDVGNSTKHQSFFYGLVLLRTCRETARGDANIEERPVVGPASLLC
jgi:hypothetical protein